MSSFKRQRSVEMFSQYRFFSSLRTPYSLPSSSSWWCSAYAGGEDTREEDREANRRGKIVKKGEGRVILLLSSIDGSQRCILNILVLFPFRLFLFGSKGVLPVLVLGCWWTELLWWWWIGIVAEKKKKEANEGIKTCYESSLNSFPMFLPMGFCWFWCWYWVCDEVVPVRWGWILFGLLLLMLMVVVTSRSVESNSVKPPL